MRVVATAVALVVAQAGGSVAGDGALSLKELNGWEAVGRLTIANRAMCTGALIAPDLVLTAAHCLYDPVTGRKVAPGEIRFEAGLSQGAAKARRGVAVAVEHPGYDHLRRSPNEASVDIALLRLDRAISPSLIRPFATDARPARGDALGVISYTHSRRNSPLLQHPCHVLARKGDTLVMNCEVDFGASGAPVFAVQGGAQPRLVSVISSKAAMGDRAVSVGTVVERTLKVLLGRAG